MSRRLVVLLAPLLVVCLGAAAAYLGTVPRTEPNQVVELAPGVYFRHGDLDGRGHCNNGFVIFREFVLVIDGNFPGGAEACLADIRKVTDKPVRFVFNTHHHGDHAYGNPVWVKAGVVPIAHENVAREMARVEPGRWRDAMSREDVKATGLDAPVPPRVTFPDRLVIDDGSQRVELLHFGHAHTRGDGFAYLPGHKILFTGDAVVNGPYNYMGDGNTESWVEVVDALRRLAVDIVAPGHGPPGDRTVLDDQRSFIASLREAVIGGTRAGRTAEELVKSFQPTEATRRYLGNMFEGQVGKVRAELLGLEMPRELEALGLREGAPMKGPGWLPPSKVVAALSPEEIKELAAVVPAACKIVAAPAEESAFLREVADADGLIGRATPAAMAAGQKLRWVHTPGDEAMGGRAPGAGAGSRGVTVTGGNQVAAPSVADHLLATLLALTRGLGPALEARRGARDLQKPGDPAPRELLELRGRRLVVVGLGPAGLEVARRAAAFGARVAGIDGEARAAPGVLSVDPPAKALEAARGAELLVVTAPLLPSTRGLVGEKLLESLAPGAYVVVAAPRGVVDLVALERAAAAGRLGGLGLDLIDPEPLPDTSPLWRLSNVLITPHRAEDSSGARVRTRLLTRENLRRFAAGEPLLCVVDPNQSN